MYFGIDHVLYDTDAPFAVMPVRTSQISNKTINELNLSDKDKKKILFKNYLNFIFQN